MLKYRLISELGYIEFATLGGLQEFAATNNIQNPNYIEISEPSAEEDRASKLPYDLKFGESLIVAFLEDNRRMPTSFTVEQTLTMFSTFDAIERAARLGDIKTLKTLMENAETDAIFTQERKDKYLQMIADYQSLTI